MIKQNFKKIRRFSIKKNFILEEIKKSDNQEEKKKNNRKFDLKSVGNFVNISYNLVAPLFWGAILGFIIDNSYQTKPKFTLIFIFVGTIITFYNLWRLTNASH